MGQPHRRYAVSLVVSCLLMTGSAWLLAATPSSSQAPLKLVTGPHYAPYAADYLPHKGLGPYLAKQVLEGMGRPVTVAMRPWKRAYREALSGQFDAVLPYVATPSREADYLFSVPIFETRAYAYVRMDSDLEAHSIEGLKGLTYCNPVGFTDEDVLKTMRSDGLINRVTPASLKSCFNMLRVGRVDFVKTNQRVAAHMITAGDLSADQVRPLPFVVEKSALRLMVPRTRPDARALIKAFNERFRAMQDAGRIEVLKEGYLESVAPGAGLPRIGPSAAEPLTR